VLLLDDGRGAGRAAAAGALLLAAIATSGYGLFVLAFATLDVLFDRRRWRLWPVVTVPALTWLAWYALLGRFGVATHGDPFTLEHVLSIPSFIVRGLGSAFGGATGVGPVVGIAVALAVVLWAVTVAIRTHAPPGRRALAALGAIVVMYGLLALVRSELEDVDATQYTRYTYLSAILALIALAALVDRPEIPAGRGRLAAVGAFAALFALAATWNVVLLISGRGLFAGRADLTRALVELGLERPLPDGVRADLSLVLVPSPDALPGIIERFGSPLADSLAGDAIPPISDAARADALQRARNPPDWLRSEQPP
jgi:hypothetical protein